MRWRRLGDEKDCLARFSQRYHYSSYNSYYCCCYCYYCYMYFYLYDYNDY